MSERIDQSIVLLRIILLIASVLILSSLRLGAQTSTKTLRVIDEETLEPIEAAYVSVDKQWSLITNANGSVQLPASRSVQDTIQIQCIGYKTERIAMGRVLSSKGRYTVHLCPDLHSLSEVVVRGERRAVSASSVASKVSRLDIENSLGQSLADLLEHISGVSTIQTGANTSKPVIHGMHGNRILIVNNGVRQSGQQWGEGHAPEVDMSSSNTINLVKGAESVRYGAEAMGGTIVMEQAVLPYQSTSLSGGANCMIGSNGRRYAQSARIEGTIPGLRALAWRLQGAYNTSGDRHTPNYILNNTGSRGSNLAASLGYDHGALRLEAFYSRYTDASGILRSAQLGNVDLLRERISLGRPPLEVIKPFSREIDYPKEEVIHHTASFKARYTHRKLGTALYQLSYQKDDRREYRIRRNNNSHIPEVALNLTSLQNQLRWDLNYGAFSTEIGAQYIHTNNYSTPGNGVVPLIPNYVDDSWGAYALQKYHRGAWNAEAGLRLDGQSTRAAGFNHYGRAYGGRNDFINLTYSLSGRYRPNKHWSLTSNFGVAWRAPHVHELYSNGVEHGSGAYLRGDSTLRSEQSYKWVTSTSYTNRFITISADAYVQWVRNFIYDEPQSGQYFTLISGIYPLFVYKQTSAFFRGIDLDVSVTPFKHWHYSLTTALIWANELSTGAYLPYIPPMRIDHELTYTPQLSRSLSLEVGLGHRFVSKQTRFDPNKDLISYSPEAYHLLSAELGLQWQFPRGYKLTIRLSGDNLLDFEYKEYTNRARYYAHDLGRDVRLSANWQF